MSTSIHRFVRVAAQLAALSLALAISSSVMVSTARSDALRTPTSASAPQICIGNFAPMTGAMASYGINSNNGIQLAVEQINQNGGVLGLPVRVVIEDDQSKAGQPAAAVKKLISSDHAVAIIGEFPSSFSLEAAPICQAAEIPMLSPGTSAPSLTEKGNYIFRTCFVDNFQGTVMARFALENLKIKRVALLVAVNQDHSVSATKFFADYFKSHGGEIVEEQSYSTGDKDFKGQLTAIKSANPEAIFAPGYYTEAALIARQAKSLGLKVPLLGCDGFSSPKLIEMGGSAIDGTYFSSNFSADSSLPRAKDFTSDFKARYNSSPDEVSALAYDSIMLLADAIKRAGTTSAPAIQQALATTKDFPGVTGAITFDQNRNPVKSAVVLEVKDGDFRPVTTIVP